MPIAISVILPVYRNAESLEPLYRRLCAVFDSLKADFDIIFVDDASPDESLTILEQLARRDPRVSVLALAQNVGQHRAVLAGLSYARGEWTVIMDADLQDAPETIPLLLSAGQSGVAAVFAGRQGNYESRIRLITSRLFKGTLHLLTGIPVNAGMFVIINREMREKLLNMQAKMVQQAPYVVAMIGCAGLPIESIPVTRSTRVAGQSAYTSWKRVKSGWRGIRWVLAWKWHCLTQDNGKAPGQSLADPKSIPCAEPAIDHLIGARFDDHKGA